MAKLDSVQQTIDELIRSAPGRVGLVVKDLGTGEALQWAPDERFPAASVIKIPVLVEALRLHQSGGLQLDERIPVRPEDRVGGFGVIKELGSVESLSLIDLLTLMVIISDNTAANLCIERVGMQAVNDLTASLGLKNTVLQRKMMDMAARAAGLDNFTTPADMALILELLATRRILTPELCDLAVDIMKRQQVRDRLPLLLPAEAVVAHKTGELPGVRHDTGIVYVDSTPIVVAALTSEFESPVEQGLVGGEASSLIAQISREIYYAIVSA